MANVEKRLTRDGDDSRLSDLQLSARFHAKRELCVRSTENNFAKLTPIFVWFCRYFSRNDPWLVAGGVLKRNVKGRRLLLLVSRQRGRSQRTIFVQPRYALNFVSKVRLALAD